MGREFVAMDPMEDQTSSCTCSEASPFNCTCPRVDTAMLHMLLELSRPVEQPVTQSIQHRPMAPRPVAPRPMSMSFRTRPVAQPVTQSIQHRRMPPRPVAPRPTRFRTLIPSTGNSGPHLVSTLLNFAPNHNPGVPESQNGVRASVSEISNIEASQGTPVESRSTELRPIEQYIAERLGAIYLEPDGTPSLPIINENSGPPSVPSTAVNFAPRQNPGVRESENIARSADSGPRVSVHLPIIPVESTAPGFRPIVRYFGDTIGGLVQIPDDGRYLMVSVEFWFWACTRRNPLEVQNAAVEDYRMLEGMGLLRLVSEYPHQES